MAVVAMLDRPVTSFRGFCRCGCGKRLRDYRSVWAKGHMRKEPLAKRFWRHVRKTGGCWYWTAGIYRGGYGRIWGGGMVRRMLMAYRVSYEMHYGEVPQHLDVLHKCDTPPCVNPEHLFLGTHQDNMSDATKKGRMAHGSKAAKAVLSEEEVLEIRKRYFLGESSYRSLGVAFGVGKTAIEGVIRRKTWRHLP